MHSILIIIQTNGKLFTDEIREKVIYCLGYFYEITIDKQIQVL